MVKNLQVKNFKILKDENIDVKQLTVFCGENSSGKSTAITAMLFTSNYRKANNKQFDYYINYALDRLINWIDGEFTISVVDDNENKGKVSQNRGGIGFTIDETFNFISTFICAERIGPRKVYDKLNNTQDFIDIHGMLAPFFYHQKQNEEISELAVDDMEDITLRSQVAYWLNHILETTVKTENIQDNIIVSYQAPHDVEPYSPLNTGYGTSMVFPILIACLTAKIGDTIIIENPEVHLHPKAQSKLADFFAFIAQKGVQIILETHCEHLIYKLCYNVNQGIIDNDKVVFQYKEINKPFNAIYTDKKGRFIDKDGNQHKFPTGFFDATLTEYLKIYR